MEVFLWIRIGGLNEFSKLSQDEQIKLQILRDQPSAVWFGEWSGDVEASARQLAERADDDKFAQVVVYNIPDRDCGQYSSGGLNSGDEYYLWVKALAEGMGEQKAIYILEPDALALGACSDAEGELKNRLALISAAVSILKDKNSESMVYIDVGHSAWLPTDVLVERLQSSGIENADGFALNTSNYQLTSDQIRYGKDVLSKLKLDGKNFIIDTSRNGNGPVENPQSPEDSWCNPEGRAIGELPSLNTGDPDVFAFLWVKRPGESDGNCNKGPSAGQFWKEMALELVQQAEK